MEELGLVGRHVDVDRAVVRAPLAGQAQVERVIDLAALPAVGDDLAAQHLEEQPRAPARRVLLLARDHVARAHHALGVGLAALSDADAAQRRVREVAAVVGVGELHGRPRRVVIRSQLEVDVDRERIDDLARVHLALGIPDALELPEGLHDLGAVLLFEELGALLAVAVLARERAAVADAEVARLLHEVPVALDPVRVAQVEADPRMHAALAEVAVRRALVAVGVVERAQVAQVGPDLRRRNGRVLPAGPVVVPVGRERGGAEAALADLPDRAAVAAFLRRGDDRDALALVAALAGQPRDERVDPRLALLDRVGAELHEQPRLAVVGLGQLLDRVDVHLQVLLVPDEPLVDALEADRLEALDRSP